MNRTARTLAVTLSAPALLLLAACGGKDDDAGNGGASDTAAVATTPAGTTTPPPPAGTDTAAAAAGTVTDPQIAAIAVAANSVDSAGGVLAQQKGTNPKVKEFAS